MAGRGLGIGGALSGTMKKRARAVAQKTKEASRVSPAVGKKAPMRSAKPISSRISSMTGSGSPLAAGGRPARQSGVRPEPRGKATPRSGGVKSIGRARPSRAGTRRRGPGPIVA